MISNHISPAVVLTLLMALSVACSKDKKDEASAADLAVASAPAASSLTPPEVTKAEEAPPDEAESDEAEDDENDDQGATDEPKAADKPDQAPAKPSTGASNTNTTKEKAAKADTPASYDGPDPCKATKFNFSAVKQACQKSGRAGAKSLMKQLVKKSKESGKSVKCSGCHSSQKTYELKPNAVSDLRGLF